MKNALIHFDTSRDGMRLTDVFLDGKIGTVKGNLTVTFCGEDGPSLGKRRICFVSRSPNSVSLLSESERERVSFDFFPGSTVECTSDAVDSDLLITTKPVENTLTPLGGTVSVTYLTAFRRHEVCRSDLHLTVTVNE